MGVPKRTLGKIVADVLGYKVRIMLASRSTEKEDRTGKMIRTSVMGDSGKFGVYANKKKFIKGDFKNKDEASNYILALVEKKK